MRRSEINGLMRSSVKFLDRMHFRLPPWAFWHPSDWAGKGGPAREIVHNALGWDLTDFGSGEFGREGLILFTIRNGSISHDKKPYAEKIMITEENQETPMHFHWSKMEDIINRGGGNLVMELYGSTPAEEFSKEPITVSVDGITRTVQPGGTIVLSPGESICLQQGVYHRFFGEPGKGTVLLGEVSSVNDDAADNRFYKKQGRFPQIIEDEEPLFLLVNDYHRYVT